jgi:hypothetical protein
MGLPNVNPRVVFQGSGTRGPFELQVSGTPIRVRNSAYLTVQRYSSTTDEDGVALVLDTDFTVDNTDEDDVSISLTLAQAVLASGERLVVTRTQSISQVIELARGGDFSGPALAKAISILSEQMQEVRRDVNRAIKTDWLETQSREIPLAPISDPVVLTREIDGSISTYPISDIAAELNALLIQIGAETGTGFLAIKDGLISTTRTMAATGGLGIANATGESGNPTYSITDAQLVALLGLSPSDGDLIEWDSATACSVINKNALAITSTSGTEKTLADWMDAFPQLITANTTINVPGTYATIQLAHDSLAKKRIADGVTVTIQVAAATVLAVTAATIWDHPDSARMRLRGDGVGSSIIRASTASFSMLAVGADSVLDIDGFTVEHDTPASRTNTLGILVEEGGHLECGAAMRIAGQYWNIQLRKSASCQMASGGVYTAAGDCAVLLFNGGTLTATGCTFSAASDSPLGSGVVLEGGSADLTSCTLTGNLRAGVHVISGYLRLRAGCDLSSNTGDGVLHDGGEIDFAGAVTAGANGGFGYRWKGGPRALNVDTNLTAGGAGANTKALTWDDRRNIWKPIAASAVQVALTGSTAETVAATVSFPAGTIGANGMIRWQYVWSNNNSGNNKTMRARLGGLAGTVLATTISTTTLTYSEFRLMGNVNNVASQKLFGGSFGGVGQSGAALTTAAINTNAATTLVFTAQLANSGDNLNLELYSVELLTKD